MDEKRIKERIGRIPERVPGTLKGYTLKFNKIASKNPKEGYANIVPCDEDEVEGILYKVTEEELEKLDVYEGVKENHYRRQKVKVVIRSTGEEVEAQTYIANPEKTKDGLKPSRNYLKHLLAARKYLSEKYVKRLENTETLSEDE